MPSPAACRSLPYLSIQAAESPRIEEWVRAAAALATTQLPAASRHLWLGNLAELIAAEHVGAERAASLWRALHECG